MAKYLCKQIIHNIYYSNIHQSSDINLHFHCEVPWNWDSVMRIMAFIQPWESITQGIRQYNDCDEEYNL